MTLFSLARRNMVRNFYHYFLYFGSMIFSVLIFFTFVSIQYNHEAQQAASASVKIDTSFRAASIVLLLFVAIFIWYSNSFFTKRRKKELGIYALLGLRKRQIGRMLFYENMILGLLSLAAGVFIGVLLSKFFIMILIRFMGAIVDIGFSVSWPAVLETAVVFFVMILFTSLHGYRLVYRFKLVELFHAEKQGERTPKVSATLALFALLLIGAGYWLALQSLDTPIWHNALFRNALFILFCVIAGTYLLFRSFTVYLLKHSRRHKNFYYNGTNLIGIASLFFRIKGNARVLTVIATLSAITLCAVGTSFSMYFETSRWAKDIYPFSFVYTSAVNAQKEADQTFDRTLDAEGKHRLTARVTVPVIGMKGPPLESAGRKTESILVISASSYHRLAGETGAESGIQIRGHNAVMLSKYIQGNQAKDYIGHTGQLMSADGDTISVLYRDFRKNNVVSAAKYVVVINDQWFSKLEQTNQPVSMTQVKVSDQEHSGALNDRLKQDFSKTDVRFSGFYEYYHTVMSAYGLMIFLGAFLGLVFLLATGSIIYFKQLNEAEQEKMQYSVLKKIGLTKKEISRTVARQTGFIFALPLVVGLGHSAVALTALSKMMVRNITLPVIICMGVYVLIYLLYYLFTVHAYSRIVDVNR